MGEPADLGQLVAQPVLGDVRQRAARTDRGELARVTDEQQFRTHRGAPLLDLGEVIGAGHVRLVAEGAIELGGVAHRLVDGEEQLRRVDDDVVAAGHHRLRLQLLHHLVAGLLGVLRPRVVLDVLVAEELRAVDDRPRLEVAGGFLKRVQLPHSSPSQVSQQQ